MAEEVNPLTDTASLERVITQSNPALHLGKQGTTIQPAAAIDPGASFLRPLGMLSTEGLCTPGLSAPQLLILPDDSDPSEVEALAISLWESAGWIAPGILQLLPGVSLQGPWKLADEQRHILGLPSLMSWAFVVQVEGIARSGPLQPELVGVDPLLDGFALAQPQGNEYEALVGLVAICRRLGAWLRIGPGQAGVNQPAKVIAPEPDSAVNLTLYSPNWLGVENLEQLLRPLITNLGTDSSPSMQKSRKNRQEIQGERDLEQYLLECLGETEMARLAAETEAFDQFMAASQDSLKDPSYALYGTVGNDATVMVSVAPTSCPPPALRWESWARQGCAVYEIIWLDEPLPAKGGKGRLTRRQRQDRLKVLESFELIARAIGNVVGGRTLDEDEFLINWD